MRINQNLAAFNAQRNLTQTQNSLDSSLEKLSSGYRINRAADDAAGLVNSENLRAQIGGLNQAQSNAQDATSMIQTAEGAQTEVHASLQRIRDLVVDSGNLGANDQEALQANQDEINELINELDRVAEQTQFGTQQILSGEEVLVNPEGTVGTTQAGRTAGEELEFLDDTGGVSTDLSTHLSGIQAENDAGDTLAIDVTGSTGSTLNVDASSSGMDPTSGDDETAVEEAVQSALDEVVFLNSDGEETSLGDVVSVNDVSGDSTNDTFDITFAMNDAEVPADGDEAYFADSTEVQEQDFTFQVGANAGQTVEVSIGSVSSAELGVDGIDVTSGDEADIENALDQLDTAISDVSSTRGELGAMQNRLESTTRNLSVSEENLSAAESRIRDTDMADEMVDFTRDQILQQAGTAMLAQANQVPQSVLSLLQ